ncbi:P-loop containing nucleoside triphosphate hydrolase protein [Mycena vulgaris]|nr:P-loop containing nucleoside triphosphate hydrolase protein [Mycena vulgaris]
MGLSSIFAAVGMLSQTHLGSSVKLLILRSVIETGRRLCQWFIVRFRIQYSMTAKFDEGDPAYEWMVLFLTQEGVWRHSRNFVVNATNSRRKWSDNAEYVPTYEAPQLFRWRGYWLEIRRTDRMYTLDMNALSELVEDARSRYVEVNRPNVIIHLADSPHFGHGLTWNNVKHKIRRPLSSIILQEGVVDALVRDAQEFIATEDWYVEAGIPHRRGYLLYGPPGTGKTSTIYALAGALNLEIYSLSLASNFVDDAFLQRAASSIPKHAIFLIEDIDCAFSREDEDEDEDRARAMYPGMGGEAARQAARPPRSLVSLSGLLNVIDGVGSEEGKLFFATTNYIDRLDPALLRPGRIDRKIPYELSTTEQARALFLRFFPAARFPDVDGPPSGAIELPVNDAKLPTEPADGRIAALATAFAAAIPSAEFSTAELQCYLQAYKTAPAAAVEGAPGWVADVREERRAREVREVERKRRRAERAAGASFKEGDKAGAGGDAVVEKGAGTAQEDGSGSECSSYVDGSLPTSEGNTKVELCT